jgi:hypothetical protein
MAAHIKGHLEGQLASSVDDLQHQQQHMGLFIPKIIHQSAKDPSALPELWAICQASWKAQHPTWDYIIWSDEQNLELCRQQFPWFLDTYTSLPQNIMRADAARYMYMYAYGGVYSDLDTECLKPLDPLLEGRRVVLAAMGTDMSITHSIPNAFMASAPHHPFWLHMLYGIQAIVTDLTQSGRFNDEVLVESIAGRCGTGFVCLLSWHVISRRVSPCKTQVCLAGIQHTYIQHGVFEI